MALSTQPYKGARDFYPEDERLQKYMFSKIREVAELYGYEEYNAPILEPIEIYLAKTGEEIVNEQTYVFEDRGGRQVVIRPEMTPTVSRMVAAKRQQLAYPLRWYSIPNLWRYERPQRGRLREHWQLNMDIFGVTNSYAELEIITIVNAIFKAFGASADMYEIKLNSRKLMDFILHDYLKLSDSEAHGISKLIDRMHKLDRSEFLAKVDEILTSEHRSDDSAERLMALLNVNRVQDLPDVVQNHHSAVDLREMLKTLNGSGITNVRFDISLMRGFDYYTDIIFEVFDTHPDNNRSMLGGGRYDGLVGLFGVEPVPTVGFGWGDVTLANFLKLHTLLPPLRPETDAYAVLLGDIVSQALPIVAEIRSAGVRLAVDLTGRKVGDQLKVAEKKEIAYAVIIGAHEIESREFTLKNLDSHREQKLTLPDLIHTLLAQRQK